MEEEKKTSLAERRESLTAGRDSSQYMMGLVNNNFGNAFTSDEDKDRFCAGLSAELMRSPKLRDAIRDNRYLMQKFACKVASCIWDGLIPSVHTMFMVRGYGDKVDITRDDLLEGCIAMLEKHGYRSQRPILVYEGDTFSQKRAIINGKLTYELKHEPCGEDDPNKITGGYLILERVDTGYVEWVYAPRKVFDNTRREATRWIKDENKPNAPWFKNFGEMCQKTLAKRAVRYINKVPLLNTDKSYRVGEGVSDMLKKSAMSEEQQAELQQGFLSAANEENYIDAEFKEEMKDSLENDEPEPITEDVAQPEEGDEPLALK